MKTFKNIFSLFGLLIVSQQATFAQAIAEKQSDSFKLITNPLFIILSLLIIVFLFIIFSLGQTIKTYVNYKISEIRKENKSKSKVVLSIIGLLLITSTSFAEPVAPMVAESNSVMGLDSTIAYSLMTFLTLEIFVTLMLLYSFNRLMKKDTPVEELAVANEPSFLDKFNDAVAIEKEEDIMFHHEYDGIRELDNNLPPWWVYGFYLTIVFAFIYIGYYHFAGGSKSQVDEYNQQVSDAKIQLDEFRKKSANNIDESNVVLLTQAEAIAKGKEDYKMNCSACHGQLGEGSVGPNLTDDYWLHGGSIKDVFKTIKLGYADKGMKSWENDLSPSQIQQIASYIKSLRGTNPPNGKAQQGDLYEEAGATTDSTKTSSDSLSTKIDSSKVAAIK